MEQHPIPQNISSYQFRLIGEMTLEQFGKLAGGCIIGLVFYALPLPGLVKWFFIIISVSAGVSFAFVPFEGRPLEDWIVSFIKSIYSPTEYVWQKTSVDFPFIKTEKNLAQEIPAQKEASRSLSVKELALIQALSENKSLYSQEELDQAQNLLKLFQQTGGPEQQKQKQATAPKLPQKEAQFSQDLPFPKPPDQPNILVGMVIDKNNKIVEGAIIEIKDESGDTVRAMRTNKLGQFRTVSPLSDGQYQIIVEKSGLDFDIIKIKLNNEIVPPIEIKESEASN
ncbi:MAG: hypothetical protein XD98_0219 [Microgenomates bacterium 39_6]|nr:MAG: hypothetical protein XD98_0219 [Microgenomates bacterium 39_6]